MIGYEDCPRSRDIDQSWSIEGLQQDAYRNAKVHGFWDHGQDASELISEKIALIHSEVSEAFEEYRKAPAQVKRCYYREDGKPEGFFYELADTVIRIADLFEACGIDMTEVIRRKHNFNISRPYKHGKAF